MIVHQKEVAIDLNIANKLMRCEWRDALISRIPYLYSYNYPISGLARFNTQPIHVIHQFLI